MKKLAIVTTKSITHNRFLYSITLELSKSFDTILCCKDSKNIIHNKKFFRFDIRFPSEIADFLNPKNNLLLLRDLFRLFKKVDIIYVHTPLAAHIIRIFSIFLIKKIVIIYHVHGLRYIPGVWNFKSIIFRLLEYFLSFYTDQFIVINELDYSSIKKFYFSKKIHLIKGLGVELREKVKSDKLPSTRKQFVIGVIAAFKKDKGYFELIEIAKRCQIYSNIVFRLYGYGNYGWIENLIKKQSIENIEIKGFLMNIEKEIKDFDVFLLPSHREGLNVSIQECLSQGVPVITTNTRGCRDLIINGYNGLTYDNFNFDQAIKNILTIFKMDDFEYSLLKRNSIEYSRKYLSRKLLNKKIKDVFRDYV